MSEENNMVSQSTEAFAKMHQKNITEVSNRHHRAIEYAMKKIGMMWDNNRQRISFYEHFDTYITEEESKPFPQPQKERKDEG